MIEAPFRDRIDRWLQERTLGATLRKHAGGGSSWTFGPRAKKRDVLQSLCLAPGGPPTHIELSPGRRFDLDDFVRHAFALPRKADWVRIRSRSLPAGEASAFGLPLATTARELLAP